MNSQNELPSLQDIAPELAQCRKLFGGKESEEQGLKWGGEAQQIPEAYDILESCRSAARFLRWCEANGKSTELATEWLLAEARKL